MRVEGLIHIPRHTVEDTARDGALIEGESHGGCAVAVEEDKRRVMPSVRGQCASSC
jgi:hypothetical protein